MLTYGIPPEFRGGVHMKPPYAIGSVPSLSGHANAYRWRSLPRVRRHRASKPQGSSERVLPWQVTMDQLIFASLSHTHYWYEVGMLKVPAVYPSVQEKLCSVRGALDSTYCTNIYAVRSSRCPRLVFLFFCSPYLASLCLVSVSAAGLQRVISNSTSDSSR